MAEKFVELVSGQLAENEALVVSAGAGDAGKIIGLDGAGKLDTSVMPAGIGADTKSLVTTENLAAGDLVNVYDNGGVETARKADASNARRCHGFVLAGTTSPAAATVYLEGTITGLTVTRGIQYYLGVTGAATSTPPTTVGHISQDIGVSLSATEISFEPQRPITKA